MRRNTISLKKKKILSSMTNALELPKGMLDGEPHIEILSNKEIVIDGKCTVLEYTDCAVRICCGQNIIKFIGRDLNINNISAGGIKINGYVCTIDFD